MLAASDDEEVLARYPNARIDHDNKAFYKGLLKRTLLINRCAACGMFHRPPHPMCPKCWSTDIVPTAVRGEGTIYLLIFLHQGPPAQGVDYTRPHPVATVELCEQKGLRFTSTVINCAPDDLHIDMKVRLAWIERDGAPYPVFEPAERLR